jgi:hypothetical protein
MIKQFKEIIYQYFVNFHIFGSVGCLKLCCKQGIPKRRKGTLDNSVCRLKNTLSLFNPEFDFLRSNIKVNVKKLNHFIISGPRLLLGSTASFLILRIKTSGRGLAALLIHHCRIAELLRKNHLFEKSPYCRTTCY